MRIAVRYKKDCSEFNPITIVIDLPDDIRKDEDAFWDYSHEYISDQILGEDPKWIRLEGIVHLEPLKH